ncbi:Neuronal calcium sensor 2 [Lepeophtheirus salmonis]|uniref:Neuronal calcium sensor 2 n=1 Tax=Lepeophtheirus salmonis TaxID=72036 RepID=A0A7R8H801_LEPSM|nr:Neuronal calcium sensor 2 [Lepeophtheirus salmonis]CAF2930340.1 Neuronal calcium sensor 2 [Lepeophtheirus salmonis]
MGCIKSKQGLTQEDLDFLKAHTRYDENTIKEWYKGFKQDCPNGRLTPAKFVDMYKMFFPSGNAEQSFFSPLTSLLPDTPEEKLKWAFRMYDVDGNGVIDLEEMTKIVQAIYDMLGAGATKPTDSAEERAKNIFSRMDENGDERLTEDEFLRGCLQDDELSKMLAPNVVQ